MAKIKMFRPSKFVYRLVRMGNEFTCVWSANFVWNTLYVDIQCYWF